MLTSICKVSLGGGGGIHKITVKSSQYRCETTQLRQINSNLTFVKCFCILSILTCPLVLTCSVVDDGLSDKLRLTKEDCNLSSRSESGEPLGLSSTS